jgi:hypothetical protein
LLFSGYDYCGQAPILGSEEYLKMGKLAQEKENTMEKFASANLTAGQLNAIVKNLGGEEGAIRFLRGEMVVKPVTPSEFKVFKTIKLGTGLKTADDFRKAIKENKMRISDWASDILGKPAFTVAAEETELDLVVVSVAELGFKNGATREQIYARAKELGLDLCPAEVGPQLCLQDKDQINREWWVVAMEPITDSDGSLELFRVRRDGSGLWLRSCYASPGYVWDADDRFVFSRRK